MADNDSGDKTEKPTSHALKEAGKKGDVPKSQDVGLTLGFIFSLVLLWLTFGFVTEKLVLMMTMALESPGQPFLPALADIGKEALMTLLTITLVLVLPIAFFGILLEFLQAGPIMTIEKMLPNMSHLNPADGVKRMFSMDNVVELIKSILQTSILLGIAAWVILQSMDDIAALPFSQPLNIVEATAFLVIRIFGWTCLAFILMASIDATYQHHSFTKKMKMSVRDIKDEMKKIEGDPLIKGQRRQLAQEWSQEGATKAAREANVLVVNPTHVAIALQYDPTEQKVPLISARAEEDLALAMREAAEEAGTPILRNEQLARTLLAARTEDNVVPRELFNIVAEVILWAQTVRQKLELEDDLDINEHKTAAEPQSKKDKPPPGEDLTRYPPQKLVGIPT